MLTYEMLIRVFLLQLFDADKKCCIVIFYDQ